VGSVREFGRRVEIASDFSRKRLSQPRPDDAQGSSEIEIIDHAKWERGQPCQTDAEKEGIPPTARKNNGMHTTAQFGFRVDSSVWPPPEPLFQRVPAAPFVP
jgi:hypothetical protein